jgi:hypothetical protein
MYNTPCILFTSLIGVSDRANRSISIEYSSSSGLDELMQRLQQWSTNAVCIEFTFIKHSYREKKKYAKTRTSILHYFSSDRSPFHTPTPHFEYTSRPRELSHP